MKKSKFTKQCKVSLVFLRLIDALILLAPIIYYVIKALTGEGLTVSKVAVVGTVSLAVILTVFNIVAKQHLRSPIWIVLIGLTFAVANILPLIIMLAVGAVLDEFLFTPLIRHYKVKYVANKEIDRREI